jgi:hypothetical protein
MSPADVRLSALRHEVERDWKEVRRHLGQGASADPARGSAEAALVALSLDHAYQAFEQILLTVERALGLPERTGDRWHRALLAAAIAPLPAIRPAIVPVEAERDWEDLLGFRHFLRHAYAVELDPARLRRGVERLKQAVSATESSVQAFLRALDPPATP